MRVQRNLDSTDLIRSLSVGDNVIYRVPVDPAMHQREGRLVIPISYSNLKLMVDNSHSSCRFTLKTEKMSNAILHTVYGPNEKGLGDED